jgi:hypothetical protein
MSKSSLRVQNLTSIIEVAVKEEFLTAHGAVWLGQLGFDPLHKAVRVENVHARSLPYFEILREFFKTDATDVLILVFGSILTHHRFAQICRYVDEFGHHL